MQARWTIRDIAKIAEVSPSTVSRSLNDSPLVAEETKQRIREIAREGNFAFNATARSLVTRKTGIVGLICPDSFDEYQYSLHLTLLINHIRRLLEKGDLDLIVKFRVNANGVNSIHHLINSQRVEALLIVNPDITSEELEFIDQHDIPHVLLQAIPPALELQGSNYVFADHVAGGAIGTNHLIWLGHTNILCFTVDTPERSFHERTAGYRQAYAEHDLSVDEDLIVSGDGTFEFGYNYVTERAELFRNGVTAIFSQTDIMALGAMEGLWELGLRVPDDVAIVSYDDIEFGKHFRPRLTTVHQPRDRLAVAACNRITELLREGAEGGPTPQLQRRVMPHLVVRESCGAERTRSTDKWSRMQWQTRTQ